MMQARKNTENFEARSDSLVNTAKLPSTTDTTGIQHSNRIHTMRLMSAGKRFLTKHNVSAPRSKKAHKSRICHSYKNDSSKNVTISLSNNPNNSKAGITNVQSCGSWCACAVCYERLALSKGLEIQKAIQWAKSKGYICVMIAFTASHSNDMSLKFVDDGLAKAIGLFLGGRAWTKIKKDLGIVHYIMNRDTTYGNKHGYHPHRHGLFFIDPAKTVKPEMEGEMNAVLTDRWLHSLSLAGLTATRKHGLYISAHDNASETYLTKLGLTADAQGNLSYEMTSSKNKKSLHIWDILMLAEMGSLKHEMLFIEYVKHYSGKTWIRWSNGLRDEVDAFEMPVIESETPEEFDRMIKWLEIGSYWWDVVNMSNAQSRIIDVSARTRDPEQVAELLHELRHELYLSGKLWKNEAVEFRRLNDTGMVKIHDDWIDSS